jgi:hypothetical protein
MPKKLSAWNLFVKKVYAEGKAKNKSFQFKDALKAASKRKSEMGSASSASSAGPTKKNTKRRKGGKRGTRKRK